MAKLIQSYIICWVSLDFTSAPNFTFHSLSLEQLLLMMLLNVLLFFITASCWERMMQSSFGWMSSGKPVNYKLRDAADNLDLQCFTWRHKWKQALEIKPEKWTIYWDAYAATMTKSWQLFKYKIELNSVCLNLSAKAFKKCSRDFPELSKSVNLRTCNYLENDQFKS